MQAILAAATLILLIILVLTRVAMLKRQGIKAMNFGNLDKKDFMIPPFALLYFYMVFSNAFGWPMLSTFRFFVSDAVAWIGVGVCAAGLMLFLASLVSFGRSFRVGIDTDTKDELITSGVFAFSRNPIYVAFFLVLAGQFLIFPNWILLVYLGAAAWLFHRQVLREEEYLKGHYGEAYEAYCQRVRRYL